MNQFVKTLLMSFSQLSSDRSPITAISDPNCLILLIDPVLVAIITVFLNLWFSLIIASISGQFGGLNSSYLSNSKRTFCLCTSSIFMKPCLQMRWCSKWSWSQTVIYSTSCASQTDKENKLADFQSGAIFRSPEYSNSFKTSCFSFASFSFYNAGIFQFLHKDVKHQLPFPAIMYIFFPQQNISIGSSKIKNYANVTTQRMYFWKAEDRYTYFKTWIK